MGFYDNEIKRVCFNCPRLLIMAINSIFHKNHDLDNEVIYLNGELLDQESNNFMDIFLKIEDSKYHMEFQLLEDNMAIRMYEYAIKETIRELEGKDSDRYEIEVVMPQQSVIFLAGSNTKGKIRVNLTLPDLQKVSYNLPCISASQSVEELSRDELYIFIPFQQVKENARMNNISHRTIKTKRNMARKLYVYRTRVEKQLEKILSDAKINEREYKILLECCGNIENYLKEKDEFVETEVALMGDPDYVAWSDRLREEGIEQGISSIVMNMLDKGMIAEEIADLTGEPIECILSIDAKRGV